MPAKRKRPKPETKPETKDDTCVHNSKRPRLSLLALFKKLITYCLIHKKWCDIILALVKNNDVEALNKICTKLDNFIEDIRRYAFLLDKYYKPLINKAGYESTSEITDSLDCLLDDLEESHQICMNNIDAELKKST